MYQPLFKGLTRPALLFGVPMTPFLFSMGGLLLVSFYTQMFSLLVLAVPVFLIEKTMAKKDPYIFRLIFLKMLFLTNPFSKKFHGVKTYASSRYTRKSSPKVEIPRLSVVGLSNEPNFEKLIPFSSIIDNGVVLSRDYLLLSTYKINGVSFECESDIDLAIVNESLNMCFKSFVNEPISFYFHNVRHRINDSLDSTFNNPYLKDIDEKYKNCFENSALLNNSLYLTIIYQSSSKKTLTS